MPESDKLSGQIPESRTVAKKKTKLNIVWIIPIVAAIIGAWVAVTMIMNQGPKITITFRSAEGLEAGKTKIRYDGVDIGTISVIRLSDDHKHVIATASMAPKTESFLVEDTKFWVVGPRVSGSTISGLGTLISGVYITLEIGKSPNKQKEFTALETPPVVTGDTLGRFFVLQTKDLGSVDYGTPIYFRRLNVGKVVSYELNKDGRTLTIKIFVYAPYDQYITPETRFWQASGLDVSLTANGVSVQTQSVLSLLAGGLAFETPANGPALPPAEPNAEFTLYNNRAEAYRPPPKNPQTFVLIFHESVRGLAPGAPVELKGIQIGQVEDVHAEFDKKTFSYTVPVTISMDPQRFGIRVRGSKGEIKTPATQQRQILDTLTAHGLRAQLRSGSLLTGALLVEFDIFPEAAPANIDWTQNPAHLATVPSNIEGLESSLASVAKKLDKVQYQEISDDLRRTLAGIDQELPNALHEVNGAARSLRLLMDYLERHPEALIKGKTPAKGE